MNPFELLQQVQHSANPRKAAMQMIQNNPAVKRALQMTNGRSPEEIKNMAYDMARQRGIDLDSMAQQFGIRLPK